MSRMRDEAAAAARAMAPSRPTKPKEVDPPPPSEAERERVKISVQTFKDAVNPINAAQEAARKARQSEIDFERAQREEHTRRMEYLVQGFEPPTKNGKTMSIALARAIGMQLIKRAPAPPPKCEFSPNEEEQ